MKKRRLIFSYEKEYMEFPIRNGARAKIILLNYPETEVLSKELYQYTVEVLWPNNKWRQVHVSMLFRSKNYRKEEIDKNLLTMFLSDIGYIKEVRKMFGPELTNN